MWIWCKKKRGSWAMFNENLIEKSKPTSFMTNMFMLCLCSLRAFMLISRLHTADQTMTRVMRTTTMTKSHWLPSEHLSKLLTFQILNSEEGQKLKKEYFQPEIHIRLIEQKMFLWRDFGLSFWCPHLFSVDYNILILWNQRCLQYLDVLRQSHFNGISDNASKSDEMLCNFKVLPCCCCHLPF